MQHVPYHRQHHRLFPRVLPFERNVLLELLGIVGEKVPCERASIAVIRAHIVGDVLELATQRRQAHAAAGAGVQGQGAAQLMLG
ncbi:hypothetical protein D3C85_1647300 [compost metagenome]